MPSRSVQNRWALEALLVLALAAAAGAALGLPPGAGGLLLAAVVLVGAIHGLGAGVATGAAAALAALYGHGATLQDLVELSGHRAALGPAFGHLALGALAGLAGEGHRRAATRARTEAGRLREHAEDLAGRLAAATAQWQALERRLAAEVAPVESLAAEAANLRELAPAAAPAAALALAATYMQARVAGFYVQDGAGWRLQAALGAPRAGGPWRDGPVARAAREGRAIAAHRPGPDGAWLAAPVRRPDGALAGVLAVHELPFACLTPVAPRQLAALADGLGAALAGPARVALELAPPPEHRALPLPEAG